MDCKLRETAESNIEKRMELVLNINKNLIMKHLKYYLLLGVILFSLSCEKSEPNQQSALIKAEIVFDKTFPNINDIHTRVIIGHSDDFFLIGGETTIHFDESGNIKWLIQKNCIDLVPTNEGGCLIAFVEGGGSFYNRTFHLAKLNPEGVIEWEKTGEEYQLSRILIVDHDEIIGVGDIKGSNGFEKPKLFRYTSDGSYLSSKFITDTDTKISYQTKHVLKLTNNNIVVGTMNSCDPVRSNYDFNIIEFDLNANNISERHYGGYKDEYLTDITELPNNELVLVGISESKDGDIKSWREELSLTGNAWVTKLGSDRKIIWEKIMGGSEGAWFAKVLYKNDNLLVAFETTSTDVDFNAPERPKFGYVVFDNLRNIQKIKYVENSVVWSSVAGCAYDSKGNLIMLSGNYDEYYNTQTLRLLKIR